MFRGKLLKGAAYFTYGYILMMFVLVLFFNKPFVFNFFIPLQVLCFVLGFILFFSIISIVRKSGHLAQVYHKFNMQDTKYIVLGLSILFLLQLVFVSQFYQPIAHDAAYIYTIAQNTPEQNVGLAYFSLYPNNFLLLFFEHVINQVNVFVGHGIDLYFILVIINIIAIDGAIYLIYVITKKIFSQKTALYALLLSVMVFGFTPWLTGVYSDTLSLPFGLLILYLYLKLKELDVFKQKILTSVLIGVLIYTSFLLKPSTTFVAIAIVLIEALACNYKMLFQNKKKIMMSLCVVGAVLIGMQSIRISFNYIVAQQNIVPYDPSENFPFTHWFMLGLNEAEFRGNPTYGMWSENDYKITLSASGKEEKIKANVHVIKQRLQTYGVSGYFAHIWQKSIWILSDGTFSWGHDGILSGVSEKAGLRQTIESFVYPYGANHAYYAYALQTIWLILLFSLAVVLFWLKKYLKKEFFILSCTILGSVVFILLFEGRARYLINNLGFMIIVGSLGVEHIANVLFQFQQKIKDRNKQKKF